MYGNRSFRFIVPICICYMLFTSACSRHNISKSSIENFSHNHLRREHERHAEENIIKFEYQFKTLLSSYKKYVRTLRYSKYIPDVKSRMYSLLNSIESTKEKLKQAPSDQHEKYDNLIINIVNKPYNDGSSPLYNAILYESNFCHKHLGAECNYRTVRLLLDSGASIYKQHDYGFTELYLSAYKNMFDLSKLLMNTTYGYDIPGQISDSFISLIDSCKPVQDRININAMRLSYSFNS